VSNDDFKAYEQAIKTGDIEAAKAAWERATGYPMGATMDQMKEVDWRNAQRAIEWIIEHHEGKRDLDNLPAALYAHAGGPTHTRDLPDVVYQVVLADCLTDEGAHDAVARGWTMTEFPEANLGHEEWVELFDYIGGYVTDEGPDTNDGGEPVLYRGATEDRSAGMAWTTDRDRAQWFADRFSSSLDPAFVYEIRDVPARAILARFEGRGENEVVIETEGLTLATPLPA
jgi:hypothetical protein